MRVESIPVRREGRVLGVIARNTNLATVRTPSRLELTYLQTASDLAADDRRGPLPVPRRAGRHGPPPRVGDGLIRLDADGVVQYASPNALSAYHRLGLASDLVGTHLGTATAELAPSHGPGGRGTGQGRQRLAPRESEVEAGGTTCSCGPSRSSPRAPASARWCCCRDVTELRRRERELITKDATIREIHHRVKNNLQTVAALLRLQARRMRRASRRPGRPSSEAVRRVGSIAIVHETLSQARTNGGVRRDRRPGDRDGRRDAARRAPSGPAHGTLRHPGAGGRHPAVHGAHRAAAERPGARLGHAAGEVLVEVLVQVRDPHEGDGGRRLVVR